MAIAEPVSFYDLSCSFSAWSIDDKFASKLANKRSIAIREYTFNKWISFLVMLKVIAIWTKIYLLLEL